MLPLYMAGILKREPNDEDAAPPIGNYPVYKWTTMGYTCNIRTIGWLCTILSIPSDQGSQLIFASLNELSAVPYLFPLSFD